MFSSGNGHADAMSVTAGPRLGWGLAGLSAAVVAFWAVSGGLRDLAQLGFVAFVGNVYPNIVFALGFPTAGAMILSRLPGHRLGQLYCWSGLAAALTLATYSYAQQGLVDRPGSLPGALGAAWVSSWIWLCGVVSLLTFGVLWFPDGRAPSRRWWPVSWAAGLFLALGVMSVALRPGPLENHPSRDNPLGLPLPRSWFDLVGNSATQPLVLFAALGALAALVLRYRRGSAEVRAQLRWFLAAVALVLASVALAGKSADVAAERLLPTLVTLPLLPLSVGVAVLRGRLYGVEPVVRRSLVYGWLLAAGLAAYAAVVLTLDTVLRGHAQPLVSLIAAAAVAVLYQPLRLRLQHSADRMLYGDRGDPYGVLARLGRRMEQAGSSETALLDTVDAIAAALRLPYVAVRLTGDPEDQPTAEHGSPPGLAPLHLPLGQGGGSLGALTVGRRDLREELTARERRLLADVARQVAIAAHAVLLDRALRRSRQRLVMATEEERRRIRRELHDGLGPALAGVALGVDAARNILRRDPGSADTLLADLKHETLGCVTEVRRIVDDLRPPALDELGLLPALAAFADRLSTRDESLHVTLDVPDFLPPLPAAVEAAAYRIAVEALTNVSRHAQAQSCQLSIGVSPGTGPDGELTVEVRDDGIGIPALPRTGVGLGSMTERAAELGGSCRVVIPLGGGTQVRAHLPMEVT
jgi:two-component system, NarL family, sensor kinase